MMRASLVLFLLLSTGVSLRSQWLTQTNALKSGWNAVYLHVDASHDTLDRIIGNDGGNDVQEIWLWSPNPSPAQFVTAPNSISQPAYWVKWDRTNASSTLTRLPGNVACLVRSAGDYSWKLKGRPVPPKNHWTATGQNFFGFPTVPGSDAPSLDRYFDPAPTLKTAKIFGYKGGGMDQSPTEIIDLTAQKANRGEAFWIHATNFFNTYFGPFEVVLASASGLRFGDSLGQVSFRLRNMTASNLTVTLSGVSSEDPPGGGPAIPPVPLLVRGEIDTSTLTFAHTNLAAPRQWTLTGKGKPGSEAEVVLGVDRSQMTGAPGAVYASILRFTDAWGFTQINIPVTAEVASMAGLWVGSATVSSVNHYINSYVKATNSADLTNVLTRLGLAQGVKGYRYELNSASNRVLVFGGPSKESQERGSYLLDSPPGKFDSGKVARPFPLRLIVHNDGMTNRLLQRVYHGIGHGTNPVVATQQGSLLAAHLSSARRISSVHLPASAENLPWVFSGTMLPGASLATRVDLSFQDQASNPFLHTYHPDHDNLDASFRTTLPQGAESFGVTREITLTFTAPATDFESLTRGSASMSGDYAEAVTFQGKPQDQRRFTVRGTFILNRISNVSTLTQ